MIMSQSMDTYMSMIPFQEAEDREERKIRLRYKQNLKHQKSKDTFLLATI